jgi:hypothetical protein
MVDLISQAKLNRLNVDSIERAIVLSALALRTAIIGLDDEDNAYDKVEITTIERGKNVLLLNLDITLPLDSFLLTDNGGSILYSIKELDVPITSLENTLNLNTNPSSLQVPVLPILPDFVDTFEKYLYYYASILYASVEETRNQIIRISLQDNNDDGLEVQLKITLPLDAKKWSLGHNLVESVNRVTNSYIDASDFVILSTTLSTLSNSTFLANNHILVN